jgi:heat shock protein HslJ
MLMKRKYFAVVLAVLLLALCAGCGSKDVAPADQQVAQVEVTGKVWFVHSLAGRDVAGDEHLTLEFLPDGTVKGSGGCNTFTGTYSLDGSTLQFGPFASTKKSCGPAMDEQEFTYLSFLNRVVGVKVDGDEMDLSMEGFFKPLRFSTSEPGGLFW